MPTTLVKPVPTWPVILVPKDQNFLNFFLEMNKSVKNSRAPLDLLGMACENRNSNLRWRQLHRKRLKIYLKRFSIFLTGILDF